MTTQSKEPGQALVQGESGPAAPEPYGPIVLKLAPALELSDEQLLEVCSLNDDIRIERNAQGELELMPPASGDTSNQNFDIITDLGIWVRADGTGVGFESNAGFTLPDGAMRSPDAAWILKDRWEALSGSERRRFPPICPDFIIELRSESDRLRMALAKMEEYIANGARLAWLIDPVDPLHRVYVYRPGSPVEILEGPDTVSGDPELPGFVLNLKPVWGRLSNRTAQ